jgi:hypothetical protein
MLRQTMDASEKDLEAERDECQYGGRDFYGERWFARLQNLRTAVALLAKEE